MGATLWIAGLLSTTVQASPVPQDAPVETPAVRQEADGADGEIVVTAQRREQRLQDVPIAISAFTGETLESSGIRSTQDLTQVTPGLNFTQSSYSPQPTIRGIGTRSVSPGDESVVPVYIDGVYQPAIISTVFQLSGVERIEVLKGPQSTLYGRNATGGAINVITLTPGPEEEVRVSAEYSSFEDVLIKGYANIGNETIAANVAVLYHNDRGYLKDLLRGGYTGGSRDFSIRGKVRITPAENFDITLSATHSRTRDTLPFATQPLNRNTVARRFDPTVLIPTGQYESAGDSGPLFVNQDGVAATLKLRLPGVDLTAITSYLDNSISATPDNDGTPYTASFQSYTNFSHAFMQEIYATSSGSGPFSWTAGATYFNDKSAHDPAVTNTRSTATGVIAVVTLNANVKTDAFAVYGEGSLQLADGLRLTAGGRYTYEKKAFAIVRNGLSYADNANFDKFTPAATLSYEISPSANVYARFSRAFKSGVYATSTFGAKAVNPEVVTQYEIGEKADVFSWLRLNMSAYYTDYKNMQVNSRDPVTNVSTLQNAGGATIYGVEGEAIIRPVRNLSLKPGFSLLHGKYDSFLGAQIFTPNGLGGNTASFIDASGKNLIRTPFFTASIGLDYTVPVGDGEVQFTSNIFHSGKSYWDVANRVVERPYTLVNAELSWSAPGNRYRVSLFTENLFDDARRLFVLSSATADSQIYAKPQSFGIRLAANFK